MRDLEIINKIIKKTIKKEKKVIKKREKKRKKHDFFVTSTIPRLKCQKVSKSDEKDVFLVEKVKKRSKTPKTNVHITSYPLAMFFSTLFVIC